MAAEQLTDQEKDFRRRARRRLIGAVALVLLMVTVLPMLLDDRSNQTMPTTDVAISIPSQDDGSFTSKIVPVPPATSVATVPVAPVVEPAPAAPVEPPAPPANTNDKSTAKAPVKAPEKTALQLDPPLAAAKEPTDTPDKPADNAAKKGMVSVQIGVFSDPAKVKQVQAKIAALGLKTGVETLSTPTGPKLRMRSGPYATKTEAEQALETLKGAGFSPILVTH